MYIVRSEPQEGAKSKIAFKYLAMFFGHSSGSIVFLTLDNDVLWDIVNGFWIPISPYWVFFYPAFFSYIVISFLVHDQVR